MINKEIIKANNETIRDIVRQEIEKYGLNADLNHIDVSDVTDMSELFIGIDFNGDISSWDVSSVTNMSMMFASTNFNGDISKWDVSHVTDMSFMFCESEFRGDISGWDVSNVMNMRSMFQNSSYSKESIMGWKLYENVMTKNIFSNCPLETVIRPKKSISFEKFNK